MEAPPQLASEVAGMRISRLMKGWLGCAIAAVLVACGGKLFSDGGDDDLATTTFSDGGVSMHDATSVDPSTAINNWSCIGHVVLAPAAKNMLAWRVQPEDIVSAATFDNLEIEACNANDGTCASPAAVANTGDGGTGIGTLDLQAGANGFDGFWQAQPPGDILNLDFINVPIRNDILMDVRQEWSLSDAKIALGSSSIVWDQAQGIVGFQIQDCNSDFLHQDSLPADNEKSNLGAGVSVTIDPPSAGATLFYLTENQVSTTLTSTTPNGQGGFINVPEGWVTLTAKIAATGLTVGTAHVYSKAGALSGTVLAPSP